MVNTNDYQKQLFNGDTGLLTEDKNNTISVLFQNNEIKENLEGRPISQHRQFAPADLPKHDTAFAITVHKSQGSEFDTILLMIPDRLSPVLTKQLLYTGITRAKKKVIILGSLDVIKSAVSIDTKRNSGIETHLKNLL